MCSPPNVKSPSISIYSSFTLSTSLTHPVRPVITVLLSESVNFSFFPFLLSLFSPSLQPNFPLTAVSLLSVSMSCFYLFVYFVHSIPLKSEIIWYLSFFDCLTSLSIILSRSIHIAAKGKIFFFFFFFFKGRIIFLLCKSNSPLRNISISFLKKLYCYSLTVVCLYKYVLMLLTSLRKALNNDSAVGLT